MGLRWNDASETLLPQGCAEPRKASQSRIGWFARTSSLRLDFKGRHVTVGTLRLAMAPTRDQPFPPRWIGMDRWGIGPTGGPRGDVRNVTPPRRHRRDHLPGRPANARSPQPLFFGFTYRINRTAPHAPHRTHRPTSAWLPGLDRKRKNAFFCGQLAYRIVKLLRLTARRLALFSSIAKNAIP